MKEQVYHDMIEQQDGHWWFRARRKILAQILKRHLPSGHKKILEVGCGTGGNLSMLKKFGDVSAIEMDEFASIWKEVHLLQILRHLPLFPGGAI